MGKCNRSSISLSCAYRTNENKFFHKNEEFVYRYKTFQVLSKCCSLLLGRPSQAKYHSVVVKHILYIRSYSLIKHWCSSC